MRRKQPVSNELQVHRERTAFHFNGVGVFLFLNLFIHFSLKLSPASDGQTNQKQFYFTQSQAYRWPPPCWL